ncbi:MAG: tetratricopeptide repeat protein [Wenzhouxiangella sp.]|nr:tetratricopeptide repeat protein [Wenzhouxiangella sp.]
MTVARSALRPLAFLATALGAVFNLATADILSDCLDARQAGKVGAAEICQAEWRRAEAAGDFVTAAHALFQLAILARRHGQFGEAQSHLQTIALMPGTDEDWPPQYRLAREQGILAHVQRQPAQALSFFRSAQALARVHQDPDRVARSLNDLGNAYRHIGANREALDAYIQSLEIKRQGDDRQLGTTLNNIADLFREIEDHRQAESFYQKALDQHRRHDDKHHLAHSLESMAYLALAQGQLDNATGLAAESFTGFERLAATPDQVRVATLQARIAWMDQQFERADQWLATAKDLAVRSDVALPPGWYNIQADRWTEDGQTTEAWNLLKAVEPATARWPIQDRLEMLQRLANLGEMVGDLSAALGWKRALHEEAMQASDSQRERDLTRQRVLFEVAEQQRDIDRLEAEAALQRVAMDAQRARTWWVALAGILAVALVVMVAGSLQRRRSSLERERRARLEATLAGYKKAAEGLRSSHTRLQQLLDASNQAMIGLGADDRILMINSAACQLLGLEESPIDQHIDSLFQSPVIEQLQRQQRDLQTRNQQGRELLLDLEPLALEEELQVVMLRSPEMAASEARDLVPLINRHFAHLQSFGGMLQAALEKGNLPDELHQRWRAVDHELHWLAEQLQPIQDDVQSEFRQHLVELMTESLMLWEKSTGMGRVDLAEKSRIWRVTIDEGRLRTRAMDRYLNLAKLPRQPRWREVLRTAYFVLGECPDQDINSLESRIKRVQLAAQRLGLS